MTFITNPETGAVVEIDNPTPEEQAYIDTLLANGWIYTGNPNLSREQDPGRPRAAVPILTPAFGVESEVPGLVSALDQAENSVERLNLQADQARDRFQVTEAQNQANFIDATRGVRAANTGTFFNQSNQLSRQFQNLAVALANQNIANDFTLENSLFGVAQQADNLETGLRGLSPGLNIDDILEDALRGIR